MATIHRALELGITVLDTNDLDGPFTNELRVDKATAGKRDQVTIASKFEIDDSDTITFVFNGQSAYVRKFIERSWRNLKTNYIDHYYLHRLDPTTPIGDTVGAMADLVNEGKVRYLGLSEVPSDIIRRAHAVHHTTATESKYSLFDRGVESTGVLETTRELGIGFDNYLPLDRDFLAGAIKITERL